MVTATNEYLTIFLQEASDLLGSLEEVLGTWREHPADPKSLEFLHRLAHTLKTDSGMVGMDSMKGFCRTLELAVASVRKGERNAEDTFILRLIDEFRFLHRTIESLKEKREEEAGVLDSRRKSLESFCAAGT